MISANNQAVKNHYGNTENSVESFSASAGSVSAIANTTALGAGTRKFGARVDIASNAELNVSTSNVDTGVFRIDTLSDITLVDKVRVDGVAGLGVTAALALQTADSQSNITVGQGAALRNLSGDLVLATRTHADMLANANTFSMVAAGGAMAGLAGIRIVAAATTDQQEAAAFSMSGVLPWQLPAGEIGVAYGAEWRLDRGTL